MTSSIHHRNVRLYYLLTFLQSAWFIEPVWFFYWHRFASYTDIGIIFSILTVAWVIFELPTGIIADKFGRKASVVLGSLLVAAGAWLTALGPTIVWLVVGGLIDSLGRAFLSGASEALVYDSLPPGQQADLYDRIAAKNYQLSILSYALAVIIGGFLFPVNFRLPHVMMAVALTIAGIGSFFLIEPAYRAPLESFMNQSRRGLVELFQPALKLYLLPILSIMVAFFIYDWGYGKPAIAVQFGMYSREQGIVYALMAVIVAVVVGIIPLIRKKLSLRQGLYGMNMLAGLGFAAAGLPLGVIGILPMLSIEIAGNVAAPWISIVLNRHISSTYRATVLSTAQLLARAPYIVLNMLAGFLIDQGIGTYLFVGLGSILVCIPLINSLILKLSQKPVPASAG